MIGFDFYQLREESNPGQLGEKRERYLCAMPSPLRSLCWCRAVVKPGGNYLASTSGEVILGENGRRVTKIGQIGLALVPAE